MFDTPAYLCYTPTRKRWAADSRRASSITNVWSKSVAFSLRSPRRRTCLSG